MILLFTVYHRQKGIKSFSLYPFSLEAGLDFINYVCSQQDNKLISIHLIERETVTELPVAAFNGVPFSKNIHELEQVWQALLPKPLSKKRRVNKSAPKSPVAKLDLTQEHIDQLLQQIQFSETWMAQQTQSLNQLDVCHQWAMIPSLPSRSHLLRNYQSQIVSLKKQMSKSIIDHTQLTGRLESLLALANPSQIDLEMRPVHICF
ncbi:hypothetical protein GO730_02295 [Spirosoma sp. HMF3257]|uniref:Uncharacterized protein n=1 Tax=Spirosoma telluris TaxID=2183553 RepID=A0A327NEJ5_9BACT|nr:hypothetical protein [Spirosoma telluris]RAI73537.1 hypothetical protein HMF3257_02235 [Spirosoma telluris]